MVIGNLGHVTVIENSANSVSSRASQVSGTGTNSYLAPEAYDQSRRSSKIDIWSTGCIIYELINLDKLFSSWNYDELRESIKSFNVERIPNMEKMMNKMPQYLKILKK